MTEAKLVRRIRAIEREAASGRTWPSKADFAAMTAAEVNAYFESVVKRGAVIDLIDEEFRREVRAALGAAPQPDLLRASDRSMAEYSDTRSACPRCGEWRDSPTSDCANCGYGGAAPVEPEPPASGVES